MLVEGFKRDPLPKLEVHRAALGKTLLSPDDPHIVAIASDVAIATGLPQFHPDDIERIADFIVAASGASASPGRRTGVP